MNIAFEFVFLDLYIEGSNYFFSGLRPGLTNRVPVRDSVSRTPLVHPSTIRCNSTVFWSVSACRYVSFSRAFSNSTCLSLAVRSFLHNRKRAHGALDFGRFWRWYGNILSERNDFRFREIASGKQQAHLWASLVSLARRKDTKDKKTWRLWEVRYMSPRDDSHLWEMVNISQSYGAVFPKTVSGVFPPSSGSLSAPYALPIYLICTSIPSILAITYIGTRNVLVSPENNIYPSVSTSS